MPARFPSPSSSFVTRLAGVLALAAVSCAPVQSPEPEWPPQAKQWYERARSSYRGLDADDAEQAIEKALRLQPERPEVKLLAARIALAQLEYEAALRHLQGVAGSDARAMRGRALWYSGQINEAAEELDALLTDPDVRDEWAAGVVKLARSGRGRSPFTKTGPNLAVVEMPRVASTAMIVPVELNGQPVLGLVSTGSTEVVVDSGGGREPSWVSLRFGQRIEVKDVPALTKDLSGMSRELDAPIKVLLGSNLLRHLNVTFDFLGRQFVVRNYEPPPPPVATKLDVQYIRGGGMVLRSEIGTEADPPRFSLFVDSGSSYPIVLDDSAWSRTSVAPTQRAAVPGKAGITQARLPQVKLGAYGMRDVTALSGVPFDELERVLDIELDGLIGSGVLSAFRVTLADRGKTMWLEDMPAPMPPPSDEALPPSPELELPAPPAPGAG